MEHNEKPTRRTRRSFLKRSAAAGIGAKSALIFGGLVATVHATGSGTCTISKSTTIRHEVFTVTLPEGGTHTEFVSIIECTIFGCPSGSNSKSECGMMLVKDQNGNYETNADGSPVKKKVIVPCPSLKVECIQ